jgi:hypothetical protein
VGQGRVELPTSRLSGVRSNHLSYWPWRPSVARTACGPVHLVMARGTEDQRPCRSLKTESHQSEHGSLLL